MVETKDISVLRLGEVINALDRCFIAGASPGVKMAAGLAFEVLTGRGLGGRGLPAKAPPQISFAVSVTVLSPDMDHLLLKSSLRGPQLPRLSITDVSRSVQREALRLSRLVSGDETTELSLLGRPLAVELWDDDPKHLTIGLNYLAIARVSEGLHDNVGDGFRYVELMKLDINHMDPRECLAISEMLSTMGFQNPYDLDETEHIELDPAA